jgi:hypothetical protein
MFCSLRTKLIGLLMRITGQRKRSPIEIEPVDLSDSRNPWQDNLRRMAAERTEPKIPEELDEVASFVNDLKKAAGVVEPPQQPAAKAKRVGDGTVTDVKLWWNESVATFDALDGKNLDSSDKKPNGRPANRWFH